MGALPVWAQAAIWGFLAAISLVFGAAVAYVAKLNIRVSSDVSWPARPSSAARRRR